MAPRSVTGALWRRDEPAARSRDTFPVMASAPAPSVSNPAQPPGPSGTGTLAAPDGWLFGRAADLLLGCGGLYAVFLGIFAIGGESLRALQPSYLFPLCALLISTPHYGATLLRVYEQRKERRAYAIFAVWITAALCALFVVGVHHAPTAAVLLTIYMTWSPWHYTGQNFGLSVLFLRRRGIDPGAEGRRWLYVSFVSSYVLSFLVMHGADLRGNDSPLAYSGAQIAFISLDLPATLMQLALPASAAVYLGATAAAAFFLLRRASALALLPTLLLVVTQGLWFTFPLLVHQAGITTGLDPIDRHYTDYFFWAAIGHAVQYLWITSYTVRSQPRSHAEAGSEWRGLPIYFGKTLVAGLALFTLPVVVFAPDALGRASFTAGLGILLTAMINIHHFILDGAIWKLRNPRVRALLLRQGELDPRPASGALRTAVWALAATALPVAVFGFWTEYGAYAGALARGELEAAASQLDRLAWVGRDSEMRRAELGQAFRARGDLESAVGQLERRATLHSTPGAWIDLVDLHTERKDFPAVVRAAEAGLAVEPDRPYFAMRAAQAARRLGRPDAARAHLVRALEAHPENVALRRELERLRATPPARNTGSPPR